MAKKDQQIELGGAGLQGQTANSKKPGLSDESTPPPELDNSPPEGTQTGTEVLEANRYSSSP